MSDDKSFRSTIQAASHSLQSTVVRAEQAAIAAVGRIESAIESAKAGLDGAKTIGSDALSVLDNAGRATIGSAVTLNTSLVDYGRSAINDTIDVGRKTFEARSVADVVDLHTAYAERRINAVFHTLGAINALAQNHALAVWSPVAALLRERFAAGRVAA